MRDRSGVAAKSLPGRPRNFKTSLEKYFFKKKNRKLLDVKNLLTFRKELPTTIQTNNQVVHETINRFPLLLVEPPLSISHLL